MKTIKVSLILCFVILAQSVYSQQQSMDSSFYGLWINTQYENALMQSTNKNMLSSITPQYINIDSLGVCTVYIRTEQKILLGSPNRTRQFGKVKQLAFKNKLFISQIRDTENYIAFTYPYSSVSIVFKKINRRL
jgi:hypothetical protein